MVETIVLRVLKNLEGNVNNNGDKRYNNRKTKEDENMFTRLRNSSRIPKNLEELELFECDKTHKTVKILALTNKQANS